MLTTYFSIHSWCLERSQMNARPMHWSSLLTILTCSWRRHPTWPEPTSASQTSAYWRPSRSWRAWNTKLILIRKLISIFKLCYKYCCRNLYTWVAKLKTELPYYESCNTGQKIFQDFTENNGDCFISAGIEMFKTWAKSKSKAYTTKGKWSKILLQICNLDIFSFLSKSLLYLL